MLQSDPGTPPAIALQTVTRDYPGGVRALDQATFTVSEGEHCCLLGPNGAGKTTIMRLLQGAIRPHGGTISILGAAVDGPELLAVKNRVGVVPQNPGLYPDLTVREYLTFVRDLYARGSVDATLAACNLLDYADRPTASLSGGYQRRLLVGAGIIGEPALLLLDEPTVGLDPLAATETRALLRTAMLGRTVLMSTHNLAEAEELCDTVIIVRRGIVLVHARIAALRREAAPRVHLVAHQGQDLLGAALTSLDLEWRPNGSGVWLHIESPDRAMPNVLRRLLREGLDIFECRQVAPSLEDLFVDVVTRE